MIRSRSLIPYSTSSSLNAPNSPGTPDRDSSNWSFLSIFRQTPGSGGSKLWRYFCFVIVVGIIVYTRIAATPLPIKTISGDRLSEKVTVVLNTFKRHSMMKGTTCFQIIDQTLLILIEREVVFIYRAGSMLYFAALYFAVFRDVDTFEMDACCSQSALQQRCFFFPYHFYFHSHFYFHFCFHSI